MNIFDNFCELKPITQIFTLGFIFVFVVYLVVFAGFTIFTIIRGDEIFSRIDWTSPNLEATDLRIIDPITIFPEYFQPEYDVFKDNEKPFFICGYLSGKRSDEIQYYLYKNGNNDDEYPPIYNRDINISLGYFCLKVNPNNWERYSRYHIVIMNARNLIGEIYFSLDGDLELVDF